MIATCVYVKFPSQLFCDTIVPMKRLSFWAYTGVVILLVTSILTFGYNRAISLWRAGKQFITKPSLATAYYKNDRYYPVIQIQQKYPSYPVYFLSNSLDSSETSYLWQMVQSYYLSYPNQIIELRHNRDNDVLAKLWLGEANGIVISPFKQLSFDKFTEELQPHKEYYIYISHQR